MGGQGTLMTAISLKYRCTSGSNELSAGSVNSIQIIIVLSAQFFTSTVVDTDFVRAGKSTIILHFPSW